MKTSVKTGQACHKRDELYVVREIIVRNTDR